MSSREDVQQLLQQLIQFNADDLAANRRRQLSAGQKNRLRALDNDGDPYDVAYHKPHAMHGSYKISTFNGETVIQLSDPRGDPLETYPITPEQVTTLKAAPSRRLTLYLMQQRGQPLYILSVEQPWQQQQRVASSGQPPASPAEVQLALADILNFSAMDYDVNKHLRLTKNQIQRHGLDDATVSADGGNSRTILLVTAGIIFIIAGIAAVVYFYPQWEAGQLADGYVFLLAIILATGIGLVYQPFSSSDKLRRIYSTSGTNISVMIVTMHIIEDYSSEYRFELHDEGERRVFEKRIPAAQGDILRNASTKRVRLYYVRQASGNIIPLSAKYQGGAVPGRYDPI